MSQGTTSPGVFMSFFRWLRLKNYQYEVTFSLYMLTPIEKVVFNTILILFISMLITAAYIYLPDHVLSLYRHINYYWAGQPVADQIALHAANMKLSAATANAAAATAEALKEL
ncbi:hypothetical protein MGYG_00313 [Nannizzia gypsea CBS 118893]|uniref:Uncharacterized protein n=1 Tax=Arthroderma gypseum (strain ATCC MYA-4604 / CBS 118893) TaxID=535722 RepID=E5QYT4_ARTGP|nr:hypothetical protein MGYG_00313 [Nannizzia gypsea CBS 118893]EFQ97272.1 hypothetical protein MGYG_00313 [Nannizzia gypsea CBS 118893]